MPDTTLGANTITATMPHVEPAQKGRRAIKNAEAIRKAQDKRDRKAAKRLLSEQFRKVAEDKIIT